MDYKPGLHILLTITANDKNKLCQLKSWSNFIDLLIKEHDLNCLGSVEHSFENSGGFTAVHCLTESHLSIHTWPEFGVCTCDVFLSNFMRDNSGKVKAISNSIINYFESSQFEIKEITR